MENDSSGYEKRILQALVSYTVARIMTIFFKKGFSFTIYPRKYFPGMIPVLVALVIRESSATLGTITGTLALLGSYVLNIEDELVKTSCLWASVHIVFYAQFSESTFACLALVCASTQFLRKPDRVKNFLREVRVIFGPICVMMVCSGLRFSDMKAHHTASLMTMAASFCSVLAVVLFRPDNNETIRLVFGGHNVPTSRTRQVIHGCLLFTGFLVTFVKAIYLMNNGNFFYSYMALASLGFGFLNVLLYFQFKFSIFLR